MESKLGGLLFSSKFDSGNLAAVEAVRILSCFCHFSVIIMLQISCFLFVVKVTDKFHFVIVIDYFCYIKGGLRRSRMLQIRSQRPSQSRSGIQCLDQTGRKTAPIVVIFFV